MRLNWSSAVVFGLLVAIPLNNAYPHEGNLDRQSHAASPFAAEITVNSTLGRKTGEGIKRRYVLEAINPRGIPKPGGKPPKNDPPKTPPGSKPGSSNSGNRSGAGNAPGTGAAPKFADDNQEKARAKGEALNNDLDQAIFKNLAAPERKDLKALGYTPVFANKLSFRNDHKYLEHMGIQVKEKEQWTGRGFYRKDKDNVSSTKLLILETITNSEEGVMVVKQSWKDRDQNPPKAKWTDMVHDNWMAECKSKGHDPKGLKFIVRDNIQYQTIKSGKGGDQIELNTFTAINEIFDFLRADKTKTLKIDAKSDNPDIKASYQLLSAQTHVARVLQWLKDRHNDLGDKKIASLLVNHMDHPDSGKYIILIKLT
ncbi:hypothetical protein LZ32DRAFT_590568 [Colletotrichum eremochloae]|nr:hypothetical protein LZ32DRAFT_590568 [Colletotrichum eremochloae]